MVRKKRRFIGFIALAALVLFAPLVAMAYELPFFEYDSSLELSYAGRMAQDTDGDIYVADTKRGRVYIFDKYGRSMGEVNSIAQPAAVAVGPADEIYVASPHGVYLLGDNGQANSIVGQDEVVSPVDMAVDTAGRIYLLDAGASSVKVFTSAGVSLGEFAGGANKYPVSIAIGKDSVTTEDRVYIGYSIEVSNAVDTDLIEVYDTDRLLVTGVDFGLVVKPVMPRCSSYSSCDDVPSGDVAKAAGIAVDNLGRVYLADDYGERINIYSEQGVFLGEYPVVGNSPPDSLLFDIYGRLFVSHSSGRIDIFSVDGQNVANVIPTRPSLLSPIGGVRIGSLNPELVAGNSSDLNLGDNLVYEFEVALDASMNDIIWTSPPVAEGDNSTSVAVGTSLVEDREYFWRVRSFDGKEYSRYSYVTRFFVNTVNSAPVIDSYSPSPAGVLEVAVRDFVEFNLTITNTDRDQLTVAWYLNGAEVSSDTVYSYFATSSYIGGNVVKAVVRDGEFSVERQWDMNVMRPNTAPTAPAINYPSAAADVAELRPELSVSNSFDAEGDTLTYTFEVSRTDNFGDIVATVSDIPSGLAFTLALVDADLIENGLYYWRARACEIHVAGSFVAEYYCSNPSDAGSFVVNIDNDPVGAPAISSPANAVHVNIVDQRLLLSVDNASDLDLNDVISYEFELALDQAFSAVFLSNKGVVEGDSGSTEIEVTKGLEENSTYYWRARATDGETVSGWVSASFVVDNDNNAPTTPTVDSPATGAETDSVSPVLSVVNSEDLDGDAISYVFEIDSAANFSSPARQESGLVAEGASLSSWAAAAPLADNTRYYWRVKASDGISESRWSAVSEFFVNLSNDAPSVPVVKSPSQGVAVNGDRPELAIYGATDLDGDIIKYIYQVSRIDSFSTVEIESGEEGLAWTVGMQLEDDATYYWRSRAIDEHGLAGAWSAPGEFMVNVANENPSAPVAGSFTYNSGDEVLLQIGSAVDPDGDSLSYSVEVYSDRAMTSMAYAEEGVTGDAQIICNAGVLNSGVYYWRVRAYDGEIFGSWSDTRIIRVNASGSTGNERVDKAQGHKRF